MNEPVHGGSSQLSFQYSNDLPGLMREAGLSLFVSTYQAGHLALLSSGQSEITVEMHGFKRVMGVAYRSGCLAVATAEQIWFLPNARSVASELNPKAPYDACFLARTSHVTGEIQAHEIRWAGETLWVVNTLFSCLCTIDSNHSFVPRWRPPFITALAPEDRCHLNGFAFDGNVPKYATAHAETNSPQGWRKNKLVTGCVIDIPTGETILRGLAMPHSPRMHGGKLWLLDSGRGRLIHLDPASGYQSVICVLPGFVRGLAFYGPFAFVGLSKIRETAIFGGVPIAERNESLKCGIAVVHLPTGKLAGTFEFQSVVDEIFDVVVLPEILHPTLRGPYPADDKSSTVWVIPEEFRPRSVDSSK